MGPETATIQDKRFAPYGPPATVLGVVHHFREKEVPDTLDRETLGQIGVKEGLLAKVTHTLKFLGLLTEEGMTTREFRALPSKTDEEYRELLAGLIRNAYAGVFRVLPNNPSDEHVSNAFRPFSPVAQRGRMITLFRGLCREAGIPLAGNGPQRIPSTRPTARRVQHDRRPPVAHPLNGTAPKDELPRQQQPKGDYATLIGILDMEAMTDEEQQAVWTLIRYLKKRDLQQQT